MDDSSNRRKTRSSGRKKASTKVADSGEDSSQVPDGAEANKSKTSGASPGRSSPEPDCAICLGRLQNKSFTDRCFHMFCFVCLQEWSKVKAECPLCKQKFTSIIHNVRSNEDYDQYPIPPKIPTWDQQARNFRYHTTLTLERRLQINIPDFRQHPQYQEHDYTLQRPSHHNHMTTRSHWRRQRQASSSDFRRRIYTNNLRLVEVSDPRMRTRDTTPSFFRSNPACTHRLVPWLNRELNALLQGQQENVQFVLELIMGRIKDMAITSEDFYQSVYPYIGRYTRHFMQEFEHFARSPYNMAAYDQHAVYQPQTLAVESDSDTDSILSVGNDDNNDDDDDVIVISPSQDSGRRRQPSPPHRPRERSSLTYRDLSPLLHRVRSLLEYPDPGSSHLGIGTPGWDSPTPGPSWAAEADVSDSSAAVTTVDEETVLDDGLRSMENAHAVKTEDERDIDVENSSSDDSDSSGAESDIVFVGYDRPWQERSPILLLSSSDDEDATAQSNLNGAIDRNSKHKEDKKPHSDRHRKRDSEMSKNHSKSSKRRRSRSRSWSRSRSRSSPRHESYRRRSSHSRSRSKYVSDYRRRRSRSRDRSGSKRKRMSSPISSDQSYAYRSRSNLLSWDRKRHRSKSSSVEITYVKRKKSKHKKKEKKHHRKHKSKKHKKRRRASDSEDSEGSRTQGRPRSLVTVVNKSNETIQKQRDEHEEEHKTISNDSSNNHTHKTSSSQPLASDSSVSNTNTVTTGTTSIAPVSTGSLDSKVTTTEPSDSKSNSIEPSVNKKPYKKHPTGHKKSSQNKNLSQPTSLQHASSEIVHPSHSYDSSSFTGNVSASSSQSTGNVFEPSIHSTENISASSSHSTENMSVSSLQSTGNISASSSHSTGNISASSSHSTENISASNLQSSGNMSGPTASSQSAENIDGDIHDHISKTSPESDQEKVTKESYTQGASPCDAQSPKDQSDGPVCVAADQSSSNISASDDRLKTLKDSDVESSNSDNSCEHQIPESSSSSKLNTIHDSDQNLTPAVSVVKRTSIELDQSSSDYNGDENKNVQTESDGVTMMPSDEAASSSIRTDDSRHSNDITDKYQSPPGTTNSGTRRLRHQSSTIEILDSDSSNSDSDTEVIECAGSAERGRGNEHKRSCVIVASPPVIGYPPNSVSDYSRYSGDQGQGPPSSTSEANVYDNSSTMPSLPSSPCVYSSPSLMYGSPMGSSLAIPGFNSLFHSSSASIMRTDGFVSNVAVSISTAGVQSQHMTNHVYRASPSGQWESHHSAHSISRANMGNVELVQTMSGVAHNNLYGSSCSASSSTMTYLPRTTCGTGLPTGASVQTYTNTEQSYVPTAGTSQYVPTTSQAPMVPSTSSQTNYLLNGNQLPNQESSQASLSPLPRYYTNPSSSGLWPQDRHIDVTNSSEGGSDVDVLFLSDNEDELREINIMDVTDEEEESFDDGSHVVDLGSVDLISDDSDVEIEETPGATGSVCQSLIGAGLPHGSVSDAVLEDDAERSRRTTCDLSLCVSDDDETTSHSHGQLNVCSSSEEDSNLLCNATSEDKIKNGNGVLSSYRNINEESDCISPVSSTDSHSASNLHGETDQTSTGSSLDCQNPKSKSNQIVSFNSSIVGLDSGTESDKTISSHSSVNCHSSILTEIAGMCNSESNCQNSDSSESVPSHMHSVVESLDSCLWKNSSSTDNDTQRVYNIACRGESSINYETSDKDSEMCDLSINNDSMCSSSENENQNIESVSDSSGNVGQTIGGSSKTESQNIDRMCDSSESENQKIEGIGGSLENERHNIDSICGSSENENQNIDRMCNSSENENQNIDRMCDSSENENQNIDRMCDSSENENQNIDRMCDSSENENQNIDRMCDSSENENQSIDRMCDSSENENQSIDRMCDSSVHSNRSINSPDSSNSDSSSSPHRNAISPVCGESKGVDENVEVNEKCVEYSSDDLNDTELSEGLSFSGSDVEGADNS
ncbi:serine-rich adhesin for platelets-like [Argopecten irradians]|uniref:serine-rich adhesin for platelets-like n=1 Tax=Argopecten irradians TaxID=31199 RepID=UPI00370FE668